jgi:hypothetical protein
VVADQENQAVVVALVALVVSVAEVLRYFAEIAD